MTRCREPGMRFIASIALLITLWGTQDVSAQSLSGDTPVAAGQPSQLVDLMRPEAGANFQPVLGNRSLGLLFGFGVAAWASKQLENADHTARILDRSPLDGVMDFGDRYGDGLTLGLGTAALVLAGHAGGDRQMIAAGNDLTHSLLMTWGIVWTLKVAVDAKRPNGGHYSFPSGHTATAFAAAPVVAKHWGRTAGLAAHGVAVATALARMEDRHHYLADVLFGAAIGLAVGYEVVSDDGRPRFLDYITATPQRLGFTVRF